MLDRNDLQVTHQIIRLFENSKSQSEEDLDSLPGIYAVIDLEGQILKGNKTLGKVFGTNYENLLGMNISTLFPEKIWLEFKAKLSRAAGEGAQEPEFQMDLTEKNGRVFKYLWNVRRVGQRAPHLPLLFSILGRDVTQLLQETEHRTRMQIELNTARTIQETLFPSPTAVFEKSSIAGFYESASECGGDWWYYNLIGSKVYLWIGDVTGHGVPAALVTSAVRSAVSVIESTEFSPAEALAILSRAVASTANDQRVMTFAITSVDLHTGECVHANACHEQGFLIPVLVPNAARNMQHLPSEPTKPLGSKSTTDFAYKEWRFNLKRGDRLLFFTDGIYDVIDPENKPWAEGSIHRALFPFLSKFTGTTDLVNAVQESIAKWRMGTPLPDDVTFFAFKF